MFHTFNFVDHIDNYTYDDNYIFCSRAGCRLRKHDSSLNYDPLGLYETSIIELPRIYGTAHREFTGIYVEALIPDGTSLSYQASLDDGATWEWYNGTSWQVAGPTDWSTIEQFDSGVAEIEGTELKIRIQFSTNTDQDETPAIARVHVFYEAVWSYFEDLKRSIKGYIDAGAINYLKWAINLASAATSVTLQTEWNVVGVDSVFNLTADPGRETNLFQSYTPGSPGTVTFTASIPSGNEVEINFRGNCSVFLAADENLQISEVPAIVVVLPRAREDKYAAKNLFEYEPLNSKSIVRRRDRSVPIASNIQLYCVAGTDVEALALQDALAELFQPELSFRSQAVGEDFFCLTYEPLIDNDVVSTGLHVKTTQILVIGHKELRSYTDLPPATVVSDLYAGAALVREPTDMVIPHPVASDALTNPICSTLPPEEREIDE
jgi:hypothetical protein